MVTKKQFLLLIWIVFFAYIAKSQPKEINPNGYNVFYYPNGFKLSEGNLKDGKPDGYWITYYVNGNKKSEGNRKNFLLDSVWTFFNEKGDTTKIINYAQGQRNGFYFTFITKDDSLNINYLNSKELYVNDKKQGFSFYYYPNGKLKNKIFHKDNYKHGKGYEYAKDERLIAIEEYRNGNLISRKAVNRFDKDNKKTGNWVEVFDNGKIKSETNFVSGVPNGNYKEYSRSGKIIKVEKFENGKVLTTIDKPKYDTLQSANIKVNKSYYDNGNLKSIKNYKNSLPFGLHIFYKNDGTIENAIEYDEFGFKKGEGLVDDKSNKTGKWNFYFDNQNLYSCGEYQKGLKTGEWVFYYETGEIMQKGIYDDDYPDGKWTWFYKNGQTLRVENYFLGTRTGLMYEISTTGDTIAKGKFDEDDEVGKWFFRIGDEYQEGEFYFGQKTGEWITYYYPEMKLKSKTFYSEGKKEGKHKSYFINKKLKEIGEYASNQKNGKWSYYYDNGSLDYSVTYEYGEIIKVNDIKIK